jgi:peptide/nickel transport system ATP-binding protein
MTTPALSVQNLRTHFFTRDGVARAVDGVDFDVAPGEVLGLVGESGSGKTVTGFSILGLIDPPGRIVEESSIRFRGEELTTASPERLRAIRGAEIAMIFQDPMMTLNPVLRIDTQMIEAVQAHTDLGKSAARARAREALVQVGIASPDERLRAYPHQFSGGMRQRVVIALALCANPRLIIADEPTTALDVSIQAQIIALLKRLCRDHRTAVMLVTHDMGVIAETADRVAVMYAGRIVEIGPVREIVQQPQHPYTAGLMGSIPTIGVARDRLAQIDGAMPRPGAVPPGCAFNPRCPHAFARCLVERPELMPSGASRSACWLHAAHVASSAAHVDRRGEDRGGR